MAKRASLGRGLDALLAKSSRNPASTGEAIAEAVAQATEPPESAAESGQPAATAHDRVHAVAIEHLRRGRYQPRVDFDPDALQELADSIRSQGVVQPIVVRPTDASDDDARYEIIAGERRWRAAQLAGLHEVPVVVRELDDRAAIAVALIENIQRQDLNPLEEARALARLVEEFDLTHQQAAEAVGRSRAAVSNLLRLLDLCDEAKDLLRQGAIEMGHARAILPLGMPRQAELAREIAERGLSVREAEKLARKAPAPPPAPRRNDPDIDRLARELADHLGSPVELKHGDKGKGSLTIRYSSLDELDGILEKIRR